MHISSGNVYSMPDGLFRFADANGQAYTLDLIEAHIKLNELAEQADGKPEFWHLKEFTAWVDSQNGPKLRLGQADELWHAIRIGYLEAKKKQKMALETMRNLPSSMDSIHSE